MITFVITLLLIIIAALLYLVWAMNQKYNKLMTYTEAYVKFISALYFKFTDSYEQMKTVDARGSFQADDEVGMTFDNLKECINDLQTFISRCVNAPEEETKK